jgi:hypothetical protein
MTARIEINMDSAAFDEINGQELSRILRDLAREIEHVELTAGHYKRVGDINGNKVGQFTVIEA